MALQKMVILKQHTQNQMEENNMRKIIIQIGLEFVFGPLLKDDEDENGNESTGSKIVDNDVTAQLLDKEINDLWCSLYVKDSNSPSGLYFDKEKEKEIAPQLLEMIEKLVNRLKEINDGSFEIEDMITDHLKSLN